jgi:hypothetical protein
MRHRGLPLLGALAGVLVMLSVAAVSVVGQADRAAPAPAERTSWGDPDLEGVWHVKAAVPLERPEQYAGREFLTDEEVAELDREKAQSLGRNERFEDDSLQDVSGAYNAAFNSILKTGKRTSLVIDPPDGRIPPLTAAAEQQLGGRGGRGRRGGGGGRFLDVAPPLANPEDSNRNRCLGVQAEFLPLNTTFAQGTVMRLVQSPRSVAMYMEDDHAGGSTRAILLDGSPHLPAHIRTYLGDSRGRWEGDTLVVETTNFNLPFRGSNPETFRMIERFTRVDAENLERRVTFEDPSTWTRPWTVLIEMGRSETKRNLIFESACHEGNYGLTGVLIAARVEEQEAQEQEPAR